jgi:hypothetical protein
MTIVVQHVEDFKINDAAKVRDYDINELVFDPTTGVLTRNPD